MQDTKITTGQLKEIESIQQNADIPKFTGTTKQEACDYIAKYKPRDKAWGTFKFADLKCPKCCKTAVLDHIHYKNGIMIYKVFKCNHCNETFYKYIKRRKGIKQDLKRGL